MQASLSIASGLDRHVVESPCDVVNSNGEDSSIINDDISLGLSFGVIGDNDCDGGGGKVDSEEGGDDGDAAGVG